MKQLTCLLFHMLTDLKEQVREYWFKSYCIVSMMELPGGVAGSGPTMSKEILPKVWPAVSVGVPGCCVFTGMNFCNCIFRCFVYLFLIFPCKCRNIIISVWWWDRSVTILLFHAKIWTSDCAKKSKNMLCIEYQEMPFSENWEMGNDDNSISMDT